MQYFLIGSLTKTVSTNYFVRKAIKTLIENCRNNKFDILLESKQKLFQNCDREVRKCCISVIWKTALCTVLFVTSVVNVAKKLCSFWLCCSLFERIQFIDLIVDFFLNYLRYCPGTLLEVIGEERKRRKQTKKRKCFSARYG